VSRLSWHYGRQFGAAGAQPAESCGAGLAEVDLCGRQRRRGQDDLQVKQQQCSFLAKPYEAYVLMYDFYFSVPAWRFSCRKCANRC